MDESANIPLPILVAAKSRQEYELFTKSAGFKADETRHVPTAEDIKGYKDKVLLVLQYPEHAGQFIYYCQTHNIRIVKAMV